MGVLASAAQWLLGDPNAPLIRLIGAALGSVAGMWSARHACDMAFDAYQPRPVFWMFVVVLLAAAGSRVSGNLDIAQLVLGVCNIWRRWWLPSFTSDYALADHDDNRNGSF
ncbi:hypothetical protein [Hoeflea sp. 108]|uniref:hypothetical protein n=1 Tax=Hoeflea sp. 108 TaxID=1116369 RepID=UPI0018DEE171|nr:hypothetical protein [Hoeflea sp. 108]